MKKTNIALAAVLGASIAVSGISVAGFSAAGNGEKSSSYDTAATADQSGKPDDRPHSLMLGSVKNVAVTDTQENRISLSWDSKPNATGYYVYGCNKDSNDNYSLLCDVAQPSADIQNLDDTSQYWFKIAAYTRSNGVVYESHATELKTATKTANVANLDSKRSSSVLSFGWADNPRITGYEIYRADKSSGNKYSLYKTIDNSKSEFEDKNVKEGELYSYKIKPYRTVENNNFYADGKEITLISGLSAPANLVGRSANTRVTLSWSEKKLADGYNVYMSQSENSSFKLLGSTNETSFATDKLSAGKTYYFRVQPFKKAGDKTVNGTWSSCAIKAAKAEESTRSAPKSSIQGSGTYIEVSLTQQHMWFYENGKLVLHTDIVTGNNGSHDTPTGNYVIESRARDTTLTGPGYSSFVSYWMGFCGGYGIHDASWRSSFGGDIYKGDGSHGCVNTPYDKVKTIYEHTEYGTPVYVY